jgi:hypothetical protein
VREPVLDLVDKIEAQQCPTSASVVVLLDIPLKFDRSSGGFRSITPNAERRVYGSANTLHPRRNCGQVESEPPVCLSLADQWEAERPEGGPVLADH